ncbi:MAG: zinc ribbon domain-containing protein [Oscillospiraceae bacterium]|nr:zinc ribbon domain-containing protein [Oscillospiraceae bacterium]
MKIKCDYCGNMVDEREETCPQCGAPLSGVTRTASSEPQTIEQLQEWYAQRNLPPENITRFFIGKDIKEPRAFGIYRDEDGDVVVYKNKADGSRAVRYKGSDEAYAVNEIYQKLRAEISNQKAHNAPDRSGGNGGSGGGGCFFNIFIIIVVLFFIGGIVACILDKSPSNGYYRYNNRDYYYQNNTWYYYDDTYDDWYRSDESLSDYINIDNQEDYKISGNSGKDFEDSSWYDDNDSGSDSWDDSYDWDSGDSWDSGGMDWDSDW